jgi:hypothetical protein
MSGNGGMKPRLGAANLTEQFYLQGASTLGFQLLKIGTEAAVVK